MYAAKPTLPQCAILHNKVHRNRKRKFLGKGLFLIYWTP